MSGRFSRQPVMKASFGCFCQRSVRACLLSSTSRYRSAADASSGFLLFNNGPTRSIGSAVCVSRAEASNAICAGWSPEVRILPIASLSSSRMAPMPCGTPEAPINECSSGRTLSRNFARRSRAVMIVVASAVFAAILVTRSRSTWGPCHRWAVSLNNRLTASFVFGRLAARAKTARTRESGGLLRPAK